MAPTEHPKFNEGWWIDYLEGETNEHEKLSMDLLLAYSKTDQTIVENFQKLKGLIKKAEEPLGVSTNFLNGLHDKIMMQVTAGEEIEIDEAVADLPAKVVTKNQTR